MGTAKLFLTTPEINSMFAKFIDIFNKIEKSRNEMVKHKETAEDALKKEKLNTVKDEDSDNEWEDDEDDIDMFEYDINSLESILTGFSDVMGTIFKHHKNLCLEVVNTFISEYLPRYFKDESSNFEKKLGFFIFDDMIEYLGQELLSNFWNDMFAILIKHSTNTICSIRQAVIYGIGEFAKFTKTDYQNYGQSSIEALVNAHNIKRLETDSKEAYNCCKDNATAAMGKIIKYQGEKINENIDIIMKNFKDNASLHVFVEEAVKISEDKVANKIRDFFK